MRPPKYKKHKTYISECNLQKMLPELKIVLK